MSTPAEQAKAAWTVVATAQAKADALLVKRRSTDAASLTAIATAEATRDRVHSQHNDAQAAADKARATARELDVVAQRRAQDDAAWAGGVNGILSRRLHAAADASAYYADYNERHEALRRASLRRIT
jgi:hypothetical protein